MDIPLNKPVLIVVAEGVNQNGPQRHIVHDLKMVGIVREQDELQVVIDLLASNEDLRERVIVDKW